MKPNLIKIASEHFGKILLNGHPDNRAGTVAAAILSVNGKIYTGINIHTVCDLGFCAEASAISEMLKDGETRIKSIAAVHYKMGVIPPCGRCRELMHQVNTENLDADVFVAPCKTKKLCELLPDIWESAVL